MVWITEPLSAVGSLFKQQNLAVVQILYSHANFSLSLVDLFTLCVSLPTLTPSCLPVLQAKHNYSDNSSMFRVAIDYLLAKFLSSYMNMRYVIHMKLYQQGEW